MNDKIIGRILTQAGAPDLMDVLVDRLSLSDLQSLLLEVYRRRAGRLAPSHLLRQYERDRFVKPAAVSPQQLLEFDLLAYALLPAGFEPLELSPVCPLGTNSAVATVDQNWVLTTIRNTEVCADSTNVLALEAARRRRALYHHGERPDADTKLCASQRLVRAQPFDSPASFPHFRILSLCTAGRDRGDYRFELDALAEHLDYYLRLLHRVREAGFTIGPVRVTLTAFDPVRHDPLQHQILGPFAARRPGVAFHFDPQRESGRGYYTGAGFQIFAADLAGKEYMLVDGGFVDWTQQLLSNRKERLLTSGLGSERVLFLFAPMP